MSSSSLPRSDAAALKRSLRTHAYLWIQRFYRHELLVARAVRGIQEDAVAEFRSSIVRPVVKEVAAGLADFKKRGPDVIINNDPDLRELVKALENRIRTEVEQIRLNAQAKIKKLVKQETEWVEESAKKILRVPSEVLSKRPISLSKIEKAVDQRPYLGAKTEEWFESFVGGDNGVVDNVKFAIQTGVQRGLSTDEIVSVLRGYEESNYTNGLISGANQDQLRTLVRTAATHASTTARTESFSQLGVEKWRFVATLDSRTSIQCAANDGQIFELGKGPMPPLHPNCRSTIVPYLGEPVGNRASVDGPVPANTTFQDWLKDQPEDVQNEVLGPTRAKAWRAGDLSFKDMVGKDLAPLSIESLIEKDLIPDPEKE